MRALYYRERHLTKPPDPEVARRLRPFQPLHSRHRKKSRSGGIFCVRRVFRAGGVSFSHLRLHRRRPRSRFFRVAGLSAARRRLVGFCRVGRCLLFQLFRGRHRCVFCVRRRRRLRAGFSSASISSPDRCSIIAVLIVSDRVRKIGAHNALRFGLRAWSAAFFDFVLVAMLFLISDHFNGQRVIVFQAFQPVTLVVENKQRDIKRRFDRNNGGTRPAIASLSTARRMLQGGHFIRANRAGAVTGRASVGGAVDNAGPAALT